MLNKKIDSFLIKIVTLVVLKEIIESFGDLFFKMATLSTGIQNVALANVLEFASRITSNPWLWVGSALYLLNFFLWMVLLSRLDLSLAFPLSSLTYIIVPILAILFLKENVEPVRWAGIFLIIIGVSLAGRSAGNNRKEAA